MVKQASRRIHFRWLYLIRGSMNQGWWVRENDDRMNMRWVFECRGNVDDEGTDEMKGRNARTYALPELLVSLSFFALFPLFDAEAEEAAHVAMCDRGLVACAGVYPMRC